MNNLSRRHFLTSSVAIAVANFLPIKVYANSSQIQLLEGDVYLNHRKVDATAKINSGDIITVAKNGKLIFKIGQDAYLVRGGSEVEVNTDESNVLVTSLRLVTGALLGVFGKRSNTTHIETPVAVVGIRGTAVYVDASYHSLYTCTCYGHTSLKAGKHTKNIESTHHQAHFVKVNSRDVRQIRHAQMQGHDDDELRTLEALVGRKPKFDMA